jgi:hypothetical protein
MATNPCTAAAAATFFFFFCDCTFFCSGSLGEKP